MSTRNAVIHELKSESTLELQTWFQQQLSVILGIPANQIQVDTEFDRYGLDSSASLSLLGDLEDRMGQELPMTLFDTYPTIAAVVDYVQTLINAD